MPRFISNSPQLFFGIATEELTYDRMPNGNTEPRITKPAVQAIFRPVTSIPDENGYLRDGHEFSREVLQAMEHWGKHRRTDGTPAGLSAIPSTQVGSFEGKPYRAYDPYDQFGLFDTDWLPEEDRDAATEKLRNPAFGYGVDWIEVTSVEPVAPWPAYDKIKGTGGPGNSVAGKIKRKIVEDGYDPKKVAAYEKATKNRADVLAAIDEAAEEIATAPQTVDDDELKASV